MSRSCELAAHITINPSGYHWEEFIQKDDGGLEQDPLTFIILLSSF